MTLILEDITVDYHGAAGSVRAIENLSFELAGGEFLGIVGPSGCGKTTLLKLISGLLEPASGRLTRSRNDGAPGRIALAFQDHGLFPWMNIVENVAFGLEALGVARAERQDQALAILSDFGIEAFSRYYPHQLSGGMRQRAGLARSFLIKPDLLLLDEPFASLDAQTRLHLQADLLARWAKTESQVIYVTHDIEEAILLSDRIIVLTSRPGRVKAVLKVPYTRPRTLIGMDEPDIKEFKWHIWQLIDGDV